MNQQKIAEFAAHYQVLDEWEIANLSARSSSLTEEARHALAMVISDRKIDLKRIHEENLDEQRVLAQQERTRQEKREARDARWLKIMLVICIPLIIVGVFVRPEKTLEALVSTVVQAVGIALIALVVFKLKRVFEKQRK